MLTTLAYTYPSLTTTLLAVTDAVKAGRLLEETNCKIWD